jgi:hypothetical protein
LLVRWIKPESKLVAGVLAIAPLAIFFVALIVKGRLDDRRMLAERGPNTWEAFKAEFAGSAYPEEALRAAWETQLRWPAFAVRRTDDLWETLELDDEDVEFELDELHEKHGWPRGVWCKEIENGRDADAYVRCVACILQGPSPENA